MAAAALVSMALLASAATAQMRRADPIGDIAATLGLQTIRGVDTDICFPANAVEYEALGKTAILMLDASTAISTELPLKAAYVTTKGVRVPLQRVALLAPTEDAGRTHQIAFYLLPIHLMKSDASLAADFTGARRGFGVSTFSARSIPDAMPAFARLDEYDQPSDADIDAVKRVLAREYPDEMRQGG